MRCDELAVAAEEQPERNRLAANTNEEMVEDNEVEAHGVPTNTNEQVLADE